MDFEQMPKSEKPEINLETFGAQMDAKEQLTYLQEQLRTAEDQLQVRSSEEKAKRPPFQEKDLFPGLEKPSSQEEEVKKLRAEIAETKAKLAKLEGKE